MSMILEIYRVLPAAAIMLALWTVAALAVLKLSARALPLGHLFLLALWTCAEVLLVLAVLGALSVLLLHRPFASPSLIAVLTAFAVGAWRLDRRLERNGIPTRFPSIGVLAMIAALIATAAAFGLLLWTYAAPTHQL
jgi:hypothetical protein